MLRILISSVLVASFLGCAQQPNRVEPQAVNPLEVESLVLADNADECRRAVLRAGADVLYENQRGLILADKPLSLAQLGECRGLVVKNEKLLLPADARSGERAPEPKIEDLLKLLPKGDIKADSFLAKFPEADGRGVTVAVLDTGVELDHPMLRTTPTGEPKMVAAHDFSGQGDVKLESVTVAEEAFQGTDGQTYKVTGISLTEARFGIFQGSTLIYSQDVSAGDKFQDLGVLTYLNANGKRRGRLDLDGDRDFGNEEELYDFEHSRKFFKLGEKKTLTASLNVSADGTKASVVFDDGSHGTHVAGIAAGYDPQGLVGIAPGARVISAKIGDNRLAGGSTTTASMMLAIDYAVDRGADVINMSYGIRAGSNKGTSAIDRYVDKVAWEEDVLFSISAGNEGPGLLTVGTPAGAELALTNAAYLSSATAKANYGYLNYEKDNLWYFSSVGPLFDGGFKPTLTAPGTALSSVPPWAGGHATYSGTSMASPQVTGGLALLLSGAKQEGLPEDRASITRAVYRGAAAIAGVLRIQQGHGLMDLEQAFVQLRDAKDEPRIEYQVKVLGNSTNSGAGKGIFYRGSQPPPNLFTVQVTPVFPKGFPEAEKTRLRTYRLESDAAVKTPGTFYLTGSPRTFQVDLDPSWFASPGVKSTLIGVVDNDFPAFVLRIPVTVIVPGSDPNGFETETEVAVGDVARLFLEIPAGVSSVQVDLDSDGPMVWAQLLDSEGRAVLELMDADRQSPQVPLRGQVNLTRSGIYELDLVAPGYNKAPALVRARIRYQRLEFRKGVESAPGAFTVDIANYGKTTRLKAAVDVSKDQKSRWVGLEGRDRVEIPFSVSAEDKAAYRSLTFQVRTAQSVYDLMTDYPYFVLGPKNELITAGGLQLDTSFSLNLADLKEGDHKLVVVGAFAEKAPAAWGFRLTETWTRATKSVLQPAGATQVVLPGQALTVEVNAGAPETDARGLVRCVSVTAMDALNRPLESRDYCE